MPFHLNEVQTDPEIFLDLSISYEKNLSPRVSAGIDLTVSLDASGKEFSISYPNYSITYEHEAKYLQLSYQSKYFFRDNDEGSWYVGSKLGFQSRTEQSTPQYGSSGVPSDFQFYTKNTQKVFLVPYTISIGRRGAFEGVFVDFFMGLSFLINGHPTPTIPFASYKRYYYGSEDQSNSFGYNDVTLNYGLKIGFGWTKN